MEDTVNHVIFHEYQESQADTLTSYFKNFLAIIFCAGVTVFSPQRLLAEPLVTVSPDRPADWAAVGHLQGPGFRMSRGCSATLIAADLVVTAAHCLTGALWNNDKQQFRAGLAGAAYVARSTYRDVMLHPLYSSKKGKARLPYDLAVVRLNDPISPALVAPMPILSRNAMPASYATLLGYPHTTKNTLAGREGCPALSAHTLPVHRYGCEVVSGISGGAVLVKTARGPALAAIIVARHGKNGDALAVPVNAWLREKLHQSPYFQPESR